MPLGTAKCFNLRMTPNILRPNIKTRAQTRDETNIHNYKTGKGGGSEDIRRIQGKPYLTFCLAVKIYRFPLLPSLWRAPGMHPSGVRCHSPPLITTPIGLFGRHSSHNSPPVVFNRKDSSPCAVTVATQALLDGRGFLFIFFKQS